MTDLKITKGSANVFEDLGFDVQESQNLLLRSQTMVALVQWFNASGLTQVVAAKTLGVTQPRLNQLLKGKIEIFSLDALVNMATSAGMRVGLMEKVHQALKTQQDVVRWRGCLCRWCRLSWQLRRSSRLQVHVDVHRGVGAYHATTSGALQQS